ncbi:MAG: HTH domain-containing protein [Haloarculaceae archaeon]
MSKEINKQNDERDETETQEDADGEGVRMVLWTRRPVCGPRTEIVDRLGSLSAADSIDAFRIETWPNEVVVSEHTRHTQVIETYEQFQAWAEEAGVSITPAFDRRTVTSLIGRSEEVLTLPMMCLAVYDDGLRGVYPCTDGDETWTVTDYLDAYEAAGGPPAVLTADADSAG